MELFSVLQRLARPDMQHILLSGAFPLQHFLIIFAKPDIQYSISCSIIKIDSVWEKEILKPKEGKS